MRAPNVESHDGEWPVLRTYTGRNLTRIALPLGGIGTGTISLGGRGDLRDWELTDRPSKGFAPEHAFFAVRAQRGDDDPVVRALEGPLEVVHYQGAFGSPAHDHGLPRFTAASFDAAYPFAQVALVDEAVPVGVRLQAFNPLVPVDVETSSLPVAMLRYSVTNPTPEPVDVSICGTVSNCVGTDGSGGTARANRNELRDADGLTGVLMTAPALDPGDRRWGTVSLASTDPAGGISRRTGWADRSWGDSLLDFWDDFTADGALEARESTSDTPVASLASSRRIAPGATEAFDFLICWHFPNRMAWDVHAAIEHYRDANVGNHYAGRYTDAWDAAVQIAPRRAELESRTAAFVSALCDSDLPLGVREAALFNLSTLRSQTFFRTSDGHFFGWEGCGDTVGSCAGSCTHVWNYEQATAFLFGDIARDMREIEFAHATDEQGLMSFRVGLPLDSCAHEWGHAAADGQLGCIAKLYRDWQLSGNDAMLSRLWPYARRSLEFCWIPGGWDADRDGVMEGCQHNTMDVEYFGPNPQMGTWYLVALRAAEEMARHLGDGDFAEECHRLFLSGRTYLDEKLFNGEYYDQHVLPPEDPAGIADGLRWAMGAGNLADPELQLGPGCLVDQLVGQYFSRIVGLGSVVDPDHAGTALEAVYRYNFRDSLQGHFNHMRTFALADESAVLMATYPHGDRPERPFPYYNEVMTGFEHTAAVGMIYEGQAAHGLQIIDAIRARYDGERRNPFDEAECGHHYARAMASWAAMLALTGFHYSAVTGSIEFAATNRPVQWFFSTGDAWGTIQQQPPDGHVDVTLSVYGGRLQVTRLTLTGTGDVAVGDGDLAAGDLRTWSVPVQT